jgi:hypothetical protein
MKVSRQKSWIESVDENPTDGSATNESSMNVEQKSNEH